MKYNKPLLFLFLCAFLLSFNPLFLFTHTPTNKTYLSYKHPVIISQVVNDPVKYEWNRTWGGTEYDRAFGVATDSLNNVYLGGITMSYGNGNYDIFLVKYNKFGSLIWNRTWGYGSADYCEHIAIDSQDNIYLTGQISGDVILVKFDQAGNQLWNITWGDTEAESCFAVATDSSDNVYLSGLTMSFGADLVDMFLVKFNSSGDEQWYRLWGGSGWEVGRGLAFDSSDNIYIAGETNSYGAGDHDMVLVKYSNMGVYQWNRTWGSFDSDDAYGVKVDNSGDIYVSGRMVNPFATVLVKYDNSGTQVWNVTWPDIAAWERAPIALDSSDNIFLAGSKNTLSAKGPQICLAKFNSTGARIWNTTWGLNDDEYGEVINIDSIGNVYVGGFIKFQGDTNPYALLIKFDNSEPLISINSPSPNEFFGESTPDFNLTIIEPNINTTWYSVESGAYITFSGLTGTIKQNEWDKWGERAINIEFFVNDSLGYEESANVLVQKDLTPPTSVIDFTPQEGLNSVKESTSFTITADDGPGAGVSLIMYKTNDSGWIDYTGPFTLSGYDPGHYLISYFSADAVDNIEIINELLVKLLKQPSQQPSVVGYDLFLILGITALISIILLKKYKYNLNKK